jgi:hypothetical protein
MLMASSDASLIVFKYVFVKSLTFLLRLPSRGAALQATCFFGFLLAQCMFYSKDRLASSDRVELPICVAHSLLSHQRLRNGHMFVCRPDEPVGYLIAIITLIHYDIFAIDSRYVGAVMRFHGDTMCTGVPDDDLLAYKRDIADCQHSHRENNFQSEITFWHRILMTSLFSGLNGRSRCVHSPRGNRLSEINERVVNLAENTALHLIGRNLALHSYKFRGGSI